MFFHSFIAMEYLFTLFFFLLIARLMRLAIIFLAEFSWKRRQIKTFPQGYIISLCGVLVVRCSRVKPKVPGSSLTQLIVSFFLLLFSIIIYLNNCYLIKYN